jgi:hypothetical protein
MNASEDNSSLSAEIIGGFDSRGKSMEAIGTVGMKDKDGNYQFFCSATLINPTTVLTAKHCAIVLDGPLAGMKLVNLVPVYFAVGAEAQTPTRTVEAISADLSSVNQGGFVGLGNDVAIYHLAEAITDVKPLAVADAPLSTELVGKAFASVGYGSQDNFEDLTGQLSATRKAGRTTMRALTGKSFELMLGSYEAFVEQLVSEYGQEVVDDNADFIRDWYDTTTVLSGYEAWTGNATGDSQTCHGDSGGPLVGRVNGESKIYGVVSGGWHSAQLTCDYGTFYATIGDKTREMIKNGLNYTDPCKDISVAGSCIDGSAVRCTDKWEGDRRRSEMPCELLGQVCAPNAKGLAGCYDADRISPEGVAYPGGSDVVEICGNGTDDDANGALDCTDDACKSLQTCVDQLNNAPTAASIRHGIVNAAQKLAPISKR